jgi:outer membrane murein-binding lipoprotein Lpp
MFASWLKRFSKVPLGICTAMLVQTGVSWAGENEPDLRSLVEQQNKQIQALKERLDAVASADPAAKEGAADPAKALDESAVKKIVSDYLKENPGAGMPPSVQTGYSPAGGFVIRSAPDPAYVKWDDDCKIPFELRFRGRIQLDYYNYRVTDSTNHLLNTPNAVQNRNATRQADFSQLEIKRLRLVWEGTAFDPNLRYHFELDGNTRGITGIQNNKVIQTAGATDPNTSPASPIGGGVTVDHTVRLFSAWVAYDFHGCAYETGCGHDCPEGSVKYAPTYTAIVGKLKPFFSFEEVMGSANEQMVEYAMSEWFFDADDDNLLMGAGMQIRAAEDRFYMQALITNGNESQFANGQMDDFPGFNVGFWYDFGGTWNNERKKWDLYGDTWADYLYSCKPVLRVGGAVNIVPMDRRSLYGDDEQSRVFVTPGSPQGGQRLINLLNGDAGTPAGSHAVDDFNSYSYEAFASLHYKGFSLTNDWFFRNLNNFRTTPNGAGNIIYQDGTGANALFPHNKGLFDYGMVLQSGYFIVPKKWEVVARWSWIRGDSGDINGNGKFTTTMIPGVGSVHVVNGAFTNFHEAREFAVGVNRYWKGQLLKWQTDFSIYDGGNPAGGGQSAAGFIPGSDGWLLRTQLQLAF